MKKLIYILIAILLLIGVYIFLKQNNKEKTTITRQNMCDVYRAIPLDKPELRYGFLMAIKNDYCAGNFDNCILNNHSINTDTYDEKLKKCPKNKAFSITIKDLNDNFLKGECLEDYVSFDIDATESVTKLKNVKYNSSIENKYSIPMFKAIINNYKLKDTDIINFVCGKSKTNGNPEVMFNYKNGVTGGINIGNVTMDPSFNLDFEKLKKIFDKSNIEYIYSE